MLCAALGWRDAFVRHEKDALKKNTAQGAGADVLPSGVARNHRVWANSLNEENAVTQNQPKKRDCVEMQIGENLKKQKQNGADSFGVGKMAGPSFDFQNNETYATKGPVIIYASRTHSQLAQVIKELKASAYRPRMAVIGSRAQMCVHKEVKSLTGTAQRAACKQKTSSRTCAHYNEVDRFQKAEPDYGKGVPVDIEDLTQLGEKGRIGGGCGPCPYYLSQVRIGIARFPNPGTYACRLSARNYVIHAVRKTDTFFYLP
jgi:hypothetical protein